MAQANMIKIKLLSSADTGYVYVTKKNSRTKTDKLVKKKYDPIAKKHVEFRETKIKYPRALRRACGRLRAPFLLRLQSSSRAGSLFAVSTSPDNTSRHHRAAAPRERAIFCNVAGRERCLRRPLAPPSPTGRPHGVQAMRFAWAIHGTG